MKERFPVFDASEELEEWSDEEVERLEQEWSGRLERFTAPTPSIESTLQLIANVKRSETHQPTDHRAELESYQQAQPLVRKLFDLLAAQWNVYGSRGWIGTAVLMIGATVLSATRARSDLPMHALLEWLTYVTLITIAVVAYAFWPKNEGMSILEKLSAYTLMQQLSARFVLVVGFQMIAAVPLSWMIGGDAASLGGLLLSWAVPMFLFGAVCFVLSNWVSTQAALGFCLALWTAQVLFHAKLKYFNLFSAPGEPYFLPSRLTALGISLLLFGLFYLWKRRAVQTA